MKLGSRFFVIALGLSIAGIGQLSTVAGDGSSHRACSGCHWTTNTPVDASGGRPGAAVCLECHPALVSARERYAAGHASRSPGAAVTPPGGRFSLTRFDCLSCHDPHDGRGSALLRVFAPTDGRGDGALDATSRFCVGCHQAMGHTRAMVGHYVRHPVGIRVRASLPAASRSRLPLVDLRGTADARDDVIACTTCHYVHDGPHPFLLRWSPEEEPAVCASCHPNVLQSGTVDLVELKGGPGRGP